MKTTQLLCLAMILCATAVQAQKGLQSAHLELGGRAFLFASANYEYRLLDRFALGAGFGAAAVQVGDITRDVAGTPETGRYLSVATSQTLFGQYFIGADRHQLLLTAGLTNYLSTSRNTYPTGTEITREAQIQPHLGVGYQLSGEHWYGRLTAYGLWMPEPSGWFPRVLPWAGLSVGRYW